MLNLLMFLLALGVCMIPAVIVAMIGGVHDEDAIQR